MRTARLTTKSIAYINKMCTPVIKEYFYQLSARLNGKEYTEQFESKGIEKNHTHSCTFKQLKNGYYDLVKFDDKEIKENNKDKI